MNITWKTAFNVGPSSSECKAHCCRSSLINRHNKFHMQLEKSPLKIALPSSEPGKADHKHESIKIFRIACPEGKDNPNRQ